MKNSTRYVSDEEFIELMESSGVVWDAMDELEYAIDDFRKFGSGPGPFSDDLSDASTASRLKNGDRLARACQKFLNLWRGNTPI